MLVTCCIWCGLDGDCTRVGLFFETEVCTWFNWLKMMNICSMVGCLYVLERVDWVIGPNVNSSPRLHVNFCHLYIDSKHMIYLTPYYSRCKFIYTCVNRASPWIE
jgi:hypothetical protein